MKALIIGLGCRLVLIFAIVGTNQSASADVFSGGKYLFDLPGMQWHEVENAVALILSPPQIGYANTQVAPAPIFPRWTVMPCFSVSGGNANARASVESVIEEVGKRTQVKVAACSSPEQHGGIKFYLDAPELSSTDRAEIRHFIRSEPRSDKLFDDLTNHNLLCFWQFVSPEVTARTLDGAIVIATAKLDDIHGYRCLLLGTLGALGLSSPAGARAVIPTDNSEDWPRSKELNFLALSVLYEAVTEFSAVDATERIKLAIDAMRQTGVVK